MSMLFWGVEVKSGAPLKVQHVEDTILHLSQASLGEAKKDKGNESVLLYVNIDGQKIVLGTLSHDKCPQISYDLVFEKEFELSHNWKNGSVHFCGYRIETSQESDGEDSERFSTESEEEEVPLAVPVENGKPEAKADKSKVSADKAKAAKPDSSAAKPKVIDAKPVSDDDDDSDDDVFDSEEDGSDDEDMLEVGDDSDDEDDDEESSDEEEEAMPKNAKENKKRPAESATKTPVPEKKAKLVTPQKSGGDGKKGNTHTATPHPSKQAGKTADKSKQQTPKSAGQVTCKSCSKTFNSDGALQSHTKAKHSDVK